MPAFAPISGCRTILGTPTKMSSPERPAYSDLDDNHWADASAPDPGETPVSIEQLRTLFQPRHQLAIMKIEHLVPDSRHFASSSGFSARRSAKAEPDIMMPGIAIGHGNELYGATCLPPQNCATAGLDITIVRVAPNAKIRGFSISDIVNAP